MLCQLSLHHAPLRQSYASLSYCLPVRLSLFRTCLLYWCNAVFRFTWRYNVKKFLLMFHKTHNWHSLFVFCFWLFFMVLKFSFPMYLLYQSYIKVIRFASSNSLFFVIHLSVLPFGQNKQWTYFLLTPEKVTIVLLLIYDPVLYISFISQKIYIFLSFSYIDIILRAFDFAELDSKSHDKAQYPDNFTFKLSFFLLSRFNCPPSRKRPDNQVINMKVILTVYTKTFVYRLMI